MTSKKKENINFNIFSDIEKNTLIEIISNQPHWNKLSKEQCSPDFLYWFREDLDMVYPQISSILKIGDQVRENKWKITSPNTNDDPNDKEDLEWFLRFDGYLDRKPTKREEYAKSHREAKAREDIIEHYCYRIQGIASWYKIIR